MSHSMDQPQNESCAQCRILPEDILMLTCSHDLCLICASKLLIKEEGIVGKPLKTLNCEICGSSTVLDDSSIDELRKIAKINGITYVERRKSIANQEKSPSVLKTSNVSTDRSMSASKYRPTVQPTQPVKYPMGSPNTHLRQPRSMCSEHCEEEISYFCFECMCNCICPECIIHGSHRNHEVQTIKKAYPIIKGKTEDLLSQMGDKISEMVGIEDRFNLKKKEIVESVKVMKKQVADSFNDIRVKVDRKEKEVMNQLDCFLDDANKDLNFDLMSLTEKIQCFRDTTDQLNSILYNKDEITLLNYFAANSVRILETLIRHNENQTRLIQELSGKGISPNNLAEILEDLAKISSKISNQSLSVLDTQPSLKTSSINGLGNIQGSRSSVSSAATAKSYGRKEGSMKEHSHMQRGQNENIYSGEQKVIKGSAPSQLKNVYQQDSPALHSMRMSAANQRPKLKESAVTNSGFMNDDDR